jgi:fatty-acyl-CoA synthase
MAIMDAQLNTWRLFAHADRHFADVEIVTEESPGVKHRYTFADFARRARALMNVLDGLNLSPGAKLATLSFNTYRHLECYFAIPCTGRVLHTLNARLSPEDLSFIINDAQDEAIFVAALEREDSGCERKRSGQVFQHPPAKDLAMILEVR